MQKRKHPAPVLAGDGALDFGCQRLENSATALPPTRPRELARTAHSNSVVVIVTASADGARIFAEVWTRRESEWLLGGFTPSFPAVLLDAVVAALHQARDARACAGR